MCVGLCDNNDLCSKWYDAILDMFATHSRSAISGEPWVSQLNSALETLADTQNLKVILRTTV